MIEIWKPEYGVIFTEPITEQDRRTKKKLDREAAKKNRKIQCTFCGKAFFVPKDLNPIPIGCDDCGKKARETNVSKPRENSSIISGS